MTAAETKFEPTPRKLVKRDRVLRDLYRRTPGDVRDEACDPHVPRRGSERGEAYPAVEERPFGRTKVEDVVSDGEHVETTRLERRGLLRHSGAVVSRKTQTNSNLRVDHGRTDCPF